MLELNKLFKKRSASTGISGPTTNSLTNFCKRLKTKLLIQIHFIKDFYSYQLRVSKSLGISGYGGYITIHRRIFFWHSSEIFLWGTLRRFRKVRVSNKFLQKMEKGRVSRNSIEKFLSQCAKEFRRRTLWCFRLFRDSEKLIH